MPIVAHVLAAGAAASLLSGAGYGTIRRIAFPTDRLAIGGLAALAVLLVWVPFALALAVNAALGLDGTHPMEWLPYAVTTSALFTTLRARGVVIVPRLRAA